MAQKLDKIYHEIPESNPENNELVNKLYKSWLGEDYSDKAQALLKTQYHEIEKMNTALAMKW